MSDSEFHTKLIPGFPSYPTPNLNDSYFEPPGGNDIDMLFNTHAKAPLNNLHHLIILKAYDPRSMDAKSYKEFNSPETLQAALAMRVLLKGRDNAINAGTLRSYYIPSNLREDRLIRNWSFKYWQRKVATAQVAGAHGNPLFRRYIHESSNKSGLQKYYQRQTQKKNAMTEWPIPHNSDIKQGHLSTFLNSL